MIFACCFKVKKSKSYFNNFKVEVNKNERGHLYHGTLKSAVSQEWSD